MIRSVATSKRCTYGIPASEAEIAKLPVLRTLRLDHKTFTKINALAQAQKATQQATLRHLITTHPDMQEQP